MKTAIARQYGEGFLLTEQDLRRIYQIMVDAAAKQQEQKVVSYFYVRLQNGTILEPSSLEDVLSQENVGERLIECLYFSVGPHAKEEEDSQPDAEAKWKLLAKFERQSSRYEQRPPIVTEVRGESRDWVVLAAGEIEERVKSTRRAAFSRWLTSSSTPILILLSLLAITLILVLSLPKPPPAYLELEKLYQTGKVANPIEALLILEKARQNRPLADSFPFYVLAGLLLAALTSLGVPFLARKYGTPYVFLWGEYVAAYQRRRTAVFVLWTVVVLGIVVGVVSAYIAKALGI